jgi:glycosyltransferase involved in cell wall biosynthesis
MGLYATMKIGIDTHAAEKEGEGNSTYIRNLVLSLKTIDQENDYIFYGVDTQHPFYHNFASNPNVLIKKLPAKNPLIRIPFHLSPNTYSDALDILHVQYISPPSFKGRLVVTIHDLCFLHYPESFPKFEAFRSKILIRHTAKKAAKIITGSLYSKADIERNFQVDPEKIKVIFSGASPLFDTPRETKGAQHILQKYNIQKPYILFVGRLNPRKKVLSIIEVFASLKKSTPLPHQLVIVGKRDYKTDEMTRHVRENRLEESVLFTGLVPDEDLPVVYREAEIFVYPSLFEGFGLPVLEAMKSGTPVITSNNSSLKELVGEAGLTIDPLQQNELSQALAQLLKNPDLRKAYSEKGLARAEEYTWERTARGTLAVYEEAYLNHKSG